MRYFLMLSIACSSVVFFRCTEKQKTVITTTVRDSIITNTTAIESDTNQYLYDFIRMVEKDQKLDYSYGLTLEASHSLSTIEDDSYLWKFLESVKEPTHNYSAQTKRTDSISEAIQLDTPLLSITKPESITWAFEPVTFPYAIQCLKKRDIKFMLAEKRRLKDFKWNNQRLGFNLANTNNWYEFSLPYFSKNKKIALISIRSLCKPFLCGSGYVLLYRFENNTWTSSKVDFWVH